jgi:hypothetical protein
MPDLDPDTKLYLKNQILASYMQHMAKAEEGNLNSWEEFNELSSMITAQEIEKLDQEIRSQKDLIERVRREQEALQREQGVEEENVGVGGDNKPPVYLENGSLYVLKPDGKIYHPHFIQRNILTLLPSSFGKINSTLEEEMNFPDKIFPWGIHNTFSPLLP